MTSILDILLIVGVGLGALYILGGSDYGDPECMFRDECMPGGAQHGMPSCYPCGYPA